MNKVIAIVTLAFASVTANAAAPTKKVECSFTEPFYNIAVDLEKQTLSMTEYDWNDQDPKSDYITTVEATGVKLVTTSNDPLLPTFDVVDGNGKVHAQLTLDMNGSDGMSDVIYPLSVKHFLKDGREYFGGCSTDNLKVYDPNGDGY